jgi:DNA invertase Pin-like site-specific DNA recombinase
MEREAIKVRVNQGIAEAKRKGVRFGNPRHHEARAIANKVRAANSERYIARTMVAIREIQAAGITTQSGIARCLNARGMRTSRGKAFTQPLVRYVMMKAQDTRG